MLSGLIPFWLLALDWTLRLALAVHIIFRRRPVTTSLAWLVVLVFVPVIGLVAYFLVGEVRLGLRRAAAYTRLSRALDQEAVAVWKHQVDEETPGDTWAPVARFGTAVSGFPPVAGNRIGFINDSEEFLDRLIKDIDAAHSHVHILTYIWQPTGRPDEVVEALIRASKRGVACRVLVDAVASKKFLRGRHTARLRNAGVKVVASLPVNPLRMLFARIDLRNHRKIAVIDGSLAYVGSQNMTDSTFRSRKWRKTGPWIDASARLEGPAAQALALVFLRDWLLDSDETIHDFQPFIAELDRPSDGACIAQVVPSGPGPTPEAIHQAVLTTIYSAREEIVMTTPYFVPDDATAMALRAAAVRGVNVTLVMPSVSDSILVAAASRAHYHDLLTAGVRILHYSGGLLHAKTLTVDRRMAMMGSANFDQRSFFLNFEVTLMIYDDDSASMLRYLQTGYMADAYEVNLDEWKCRSSLRVFFDNTCQLLGPLL